MKSKKLFIMLVLLSVLAGFVQAQELGDANGDHNINIIDALVTAQYYVGRNPDPFYPSAADVTGCDGNIDIIDALIIAQYTVGVITRFPCAQTDDNTTIEYTRSGGFAGITETISIRTADQLIIVNDQRRELSDNEMDRLLTMLNNIDVSNFPHDTGLCCCDRFFYEMRISSSTASLNGTGEWSDCTIENNQVPQELLDLVELISELAQPPSGDITIKYTRSGGFAGITETISIRTADQLIIVNDERRELSDNEMDRLLTMLNRIDVSNFPHDTGLCCCDRFFYEMRISSSTASLNGTGEWSDCTIENHQVPQELLDLVALIRELAQAASVKIVKSGINRNMDPQPDEGELESVVTGNNMFAFDCFHTIKGQDGNLFFSPVSISFAFAMCYAGANGNTETEIAEVMHFTLPEDNLHNAFNAFELTLTSEPENPPEEAGEELKLHIANSTWGQKDYFFVPAFLDILALHYGAGMNVVDFITDPEGCRLLINDWVSRETEERIKDLLPAGSIDTLTRLVLTNAIYFKANWRDPFEESDTKDGPFTLLDGTNVIVPLMYQTTMTPYYEVQGEYSAVRLPYQGVKQNSMIIILPDQGQFEAFENSFSNQTLTTIIQGMTTYQVELTMPKYSYEWEDSLKEILINLGMEDAFTDGRADFSGINGETNLVISDVFHKAFVAVDEIGTEAAAATAIIISDTSVPELVVMTIDRPFLYVIRNDDTGAILFLGRVLEP